MTDFIADTPAVWTVPEDVAEREAAKRRGIEAAQQQDVDDALAALPWVRRMREWLETGQASEDGWITVSAPRGGA